MVCDAGEEGEGLLVGDIVGEAEEEGQTLVVGEVLGKEDGEMADAALINKMPKRDKIRIMGLLNAPAPIVRGGVVGGGGGVFCKTVCVLYFKLLLVLLRLRLVLLG